MIKNAAQYIAQQKKQAEQQKTNMIRHTMNSRISADATKVAKAGKLVVKFGKYNGKTLRAISGLDVNYVRWIAYNVSNKKISDAAVLLYENHCNEINAINPHANWH